MAYLKEPIAMTLGSIYFKVICRLQSFSIGMIRSCKISAVPLQ